MLIPFGFHIIIAKTLIIRPIISPPIFLSQMALHEEEEEDDQEHQEIHEQEDQETHANTQLPKTYTLSSINSLITIRQLPSQGIAFKLWPAATTLINLLDRQHSTTAAPLFIPSGNRLRVLELGSGTGVVGIAAAALFGASVTVTDLPHVLPSMEFNVEANADVLKLHGGEVNVAALSWGNEEEMEAMGRDYDLVIGSDLVYHDHLFEPLLETLHFFLDGGDKGLVFLMAHLKRWKKESAFFKKAKKMFDVEAIHTDPPCDGSRVGVIVYRFVTKSGQKTELHV